MNNSAEKQKQSKHPPQQLSQPQPQHHFKKRIGSTFYKVAVFHSDTSKEKLEDKILRLAKNDAANIATAKGAANQ
ncbi:MAG: transposon-encoded TnpW family protein [Defluviitaleaceae bacterium]|nr:transposon-encoded TnpW family protein [Defluviitaleaceae bacterium]